MDNTDRRVKRTQALLLDALIALSKQRDYEQISIRDITDYANIAYSTFFRHYADKDALLRHTVSEAAATLTNLIRQLPDHTPDEEGRLIFQHVQDHEEFYRLIFGERGPNGVLRQVQKQLEKELLSLYQSQPASAIPVELLIHHIISGILELVRWWLEHDQPYPVEQMGSIYHRLILAAAETAAYGHPMR